MRGPGDKALHNSWLALECLTSLLEWREAEGMGACLFRGLGSLGMTWRELKAVDESRKGRDTVWSSCYSSCRVFGRCVVK